MPKKPKRKKPWAGAKMIEDGSPFTVLVCAKNGRKKRVCRPVKLAQLEQRMKRYRAQYAAWKRKQG